MGKNKIVIEKKPTKYEQDITYRKRGKGVLKKTYELSSLCGVQVGLIMFSPSGKLWHYSTQPRIEKILQRFLQSIPNMSEEEREKFTSLGISQDIIDRINIAAGSDDVADQQGSDAPQREEVNRDILELQNKLLSLQEQERMLDPGMGTLNSAEEIEEHINRCCENALIMIAKRKEQLMSRQGSSTSCTNPSLSVQVPIQQIPIQQPMQQPQAAMEVEMWGTQQLQLQGGPVVGMGDPSPSWVPLYTGEQNVGALTAMPDPQNWYSESMQGCSTPCTNFSPSMQLRMWGPQQGGQQQQLQGIPSSSWVSLPQVQSEAGMWVPPQVDVPPQGAAGPDEDLEDTIRELEQVLMVPPEGEEEHVQVPPQGDPCSSSSLVPVYNGEQMVNALQYSQQPQHEMAFSGGEQQTSPGGVAWPGEDIMKQAAWIEEYDQYMASLKG